jgi:hypothetical protein
MIIQILAVHLVKALQSDQSLRQVVVVEQVITAQMRPRVVLAVAVQDIQRQSLSLTAQLAIQDHIHR